MANKKQEAPETASINTRLFPSTTDKLRYIKETYGTGQAAFIKQAVDEKIKNDKIKMPKTV